MKQSTADKFCDSSSSEESCKESVTSSCSGDSECHRKSHEHRCRRHKSHCHSATCKKSEERRPSSVKEGGKLAPLAEATTEDESSSSSAAATVIPKSAPYPAPPVVEIGAPISVAKPIPSPAPSAAVETGGPPVLEAAAPPPVETVAPPPVETVAPLPVETDAPSSVETAAPPVVETATPPPVETAAPLFCKELFHSDYCYEDGTLYIEVTDSKLKYSVHKSILEGISDYFAFVIKNIPTDNNQAGGIGAIFSSTVGSNGVIHLTLKHVTSRQLEPLLILTYHLLDQSRVDSIGPQRIAETIARFEVKCIDTWFKKYLMEYASTNPFEAVRIGYSLGFDEIELLTSELFAKDIGSCLSSPELSCLPQEIQLNLYKSFYNYYSKLHACDAFKYVTHSPLPCRCGFSDAREGPFGVYCPLCRRPAPTLHDALSISKRIVMGYSATKEWPACNKAK